MLLSIVFAQIAGIPIDTNCAPLVRDLFCYKRGVMVSFSDNNIADVIGAFSSTSNI